METAGYKEKVFDEDLLKFCLQLFELIDSSPENYKVFRKATLDSLSFSNLNSAAKYLESIKSLNLKEMNIYSEELLDASKLLGQRKELSDYLMTIRHIGDQKHFESWNEFFISVKTLCETQLDLTDFLMTTRHLCDLESFQDWVDYFKLTKRIKDRDLNTQKNVLEAVRHSVQYFQTSASFKGIFRTLSEEPRHSDAFAYGQLDSKEWLIEEATKCWGKNWGTVFVLAGWIGLLPRMIWDQNIKTTKIRSFDIDESANKAAELLNQAEVQEEWRYKSSNQDITKMIYPATYNVQRKDGTLCELIDTPDIVINTSCEHIADIDSWWSQIPQGTKVILQSNDGFHIPEHVACFKSLNDFEKRMSLSKVDYKGEKALPEFNRFMLIGVK